MRPSNTTYSCVNIDVNADSAWRTLQSGSCVVYTTLENEHDAKFLGLDISDHEQVVETLNKLPSLFAVVVEKDGQNRCAGCVVFSERYPPSKPDRALSPLEKLFSSFHSKWLTCGTPPRLW